VVVADTSAWISFLRGVEIPVTWALDRFVQREELAVTEVVVMEVLAGARSDDEMRALRARLMAFPLLRLEGLADFEEAALLYRACRRGGETVRKMTDLLVALPVMRAGMRLLHADADFDVIARHSDLQIQPVRS